MPHFESQRAIAAGKVRPLDPATASIMAFQAKFLGNLFQAGVLSEYPGADFYAIGYGEGCAYKDDADLDDLYSHPTLLATWSVELPDSKEDYAGEPPAEFAGQWKPHKSPPKPKCDVCGAGASVTMKGGAKYCPTHAF